MASVHHEEHACLQRLSMSKYVLASTRPVSYEEEILARTLDRRTAPGGTKGVTMEQEITIKVDGAEQASGSREALCVSLKCVGGHRDSPTSTSGRGYG